MKNVFVIFKTKSQDLNKDDSKTLFHHCLLHVISLKGLGVKTNGKKKHSKHNTSIINDYPIKPP